MQYIVAIASLLVFAWVNYQLGFKKGFSDGFKKGFSNGLKTGINSVYGLTSGERGLIK